MIQVRFACGHSRAVGLNQSDPVCQECGDRTVRRVQARAPRFVGVATGPYCETQALGAVEVNLAPKGPLTLKEQA